MQSLPQKIQREIYQIVLMQLVFICTIACAVLIFWGYIHGLSVAAGGLAYIIPTFFFVWAVFRFASPSQMHQFLIAFLIGEFGKLLFSGLLMILVVKYLPISLLSVLAGFVISITVFWFVCARYLARKQEQRHE